MKPPIKIGNGQGFWGDSPEAPKRILLQQPDLDFLTLDYLAEVSLSIMAIQKDKNPSLGYARDFVDVVSSLIPYWKSGGKAKIITNAGGLNPFGCAKACFEVLKEEGLGIKIALVSGDDVKNILDNPNSSTETEEPFSAIKDKLVTANAYLGASPIVEALRMGADIVITGRVADPSLTVAPCIFHFDWNVDEYDKIASSTMAGHLIECGSQVTGGISTNWMNIKDPENLGFPFVVVEDSGSFIITKPKNSSGNVDRQTVTEQILYETSDPEKYLSPDVTMSFKDIYLTEEEKNVIRIDGIKGSSPTSSYKVSATYRDGFKVEAILGVFGSDAYLKAKLSGEMILNRLKLNGWIFDDSLIECLGCGDMIPGVFHVNRDSNECLLRIAVADSRHEALDHFSKEIASLVTSGPQGICGYVSGRPKVRPRFGYWPCLIQKEKVTPKVEILQCL